MTLSPSPGHMPGFVSSRSGRAYVSTILGEHPIELRNSHLVGIIPQVQDLRPRQTYLALAFLREQGGMGEPVQLGGDRVEDLDPHGHGGGHVDPRFYVAMAVG